MAKAFADRWGVPVRAGSADAVALLDAAIEDLAALAGDPVADADARGRGRRQPGARPYLPRLPAAVRDDPGGASPPRARS